MNKNIYVNKVHKDFAIKENKDYYFQRSGFCDWKKCQSACCRFHHVRNIDCKGAIILKPSAYYQNHEIVVKQIGNKIHYLKPFLCEAISLDGKCRLHNKKWQTRVCKYFPMSPDDGMYVAVESVCRFKFKKVKNKKYKKLEVKKNEIKTG